MTDLRPSASGDAPSVCPFLSPWMASCPVMAYQPFGGGGVPVFFPVMLLVEQERNGLGQRRDGWLAETAPQRAAGVTL